jgi:1,4-alpha-glucan branching enzyme
VNNDSVGRLAIVLHTHSPWLLDHGSWPVGEEWLRQAWAHCYLPLFAMLRQRAEQGRTNLVTLGVTPVLAAQWDDPASVADQRRWLADWQWRASGKALSASARLDDIARAEAHRQFHLASEAIAEFEQFWSRGGSPALRSLIDSGAIDPLGGPITHAFTPQLIEPFENLSLMSGLRDSRVRIGRPMRGIWAPECAYAPGLEQTYQRHGVTHLMVDGPTVQATGNTIHRPHRIGSSDVYAFARDLSLTYRVWSPKQGYPGNRWYQDFHSYDHDWGIKPYRVTGKSSPVKEPYQGDRAREQVDRDVEDFLAHARKAMIESPLTDPLVVVAYDTELFGHWWHEGPQFLASVLDRAGEAGIELTTLAAAREHAPAATSIDLLAGSWGSGKDYRVWEAGEAGDVMRRGRGAQYAVRAFLDERAKLLATGRDHVADAVLTELFFALASDWAFMITKDSAADYARGRLEGHFHRLGELLRLNHHDQLSIAIDRRLPFIDARDAYAFV